jgi:predicted amidohydrolase YtcJ
MLTIRALFSSDTVLLNGHIYTARAQSQWVQALAVTGDRIDAVGSNAEIARHRTANTKVIDLQGNTVIPGITDGQVHLWFGALALHGFNLSTPESNVTSKDPELLLAKIKDYAARHPKDPMIFGRVQFITDFTDSGSHFKKPFPDPSIEQNILRDAHGHPSGVVMEGAMEIVEQVLPDPPLEVKFEWLQQAMHYLNGFGITSATMATGSLADIELYGKMRDRGLRTLRTRTAFGAVAVNHHLTPQFLADLEKARTTYHDSWVSANLVKFFSDGLTDPPVYMREELNKLFVELDKRGYQLMTHSIGGLRANGPGRLPDSGKDQRTSRPALSDGTRQLLKPGGPASFSSTVGDREHAAGFLLQRRLVGAGEDRYLEPFAEGRSQGDVQQRLALHLAARPAGSRRGNHDS